MKILPILFNTDMVRAILDNRKTVTRRVVKQQDKILENPEFGYTAFTPEGYISVRGGWKDEDGKERYGENFIKLPYRPNDVLYVCETWTQDGDVYRYKAGFYDQNRKWRPSIHMPREAARIFLRVTNVRVERLQDISASACIAEGIPWEDVTPNIAALPDNPAFDMDAVVASLQEAEEQRLIRNSYGLLWDNIIKPKDRALYGWEANPWVFEISFERISREEASAHG